jgi:YVTN family beta-propeller protein
MLTLMPLRFQMIKMAYVTSRGAATVSVISTTDRKVDVAFTVGSKPNGIVLSGYATTFSLSKTYFLKTVEKTTNPFTFAASKRKVFLSWADS